MDTAAAYTVENILDFSSDVGEEDLSSSTTTTTTNHFSFPEECAEEDLEWLSNKDAFPSVDTFVDTFTISDFKNLSPTSVLDSNKNNSKSSIVMSCCFAVPVRRARTKGRKKTRHCDRLTDLSLHQLILSSCNQENIITNNNMVRKSSTHGRKCQHCLTDKTPQWRAGPMGPKTLCNACGVRYKSGRLVPEYRPANSPTFSSKLHSNSHRKVVEMRKRKEVGNVLVNCHVDIG